MPPPMPSMGPTTSSRANIKELQKISQIFEWYDPQHIAEEITRHMLAMFMKIEVRKDLPRARPHDAERARCGSVLP